MTTLDPTTDLQNRLDNANGKPVANERAFTLSRMLRVPSGVDFTVGPLRYEGKGQALLITGNALDTRIRGGSITAPYAKAWDFDGNPENCRFADLVLECGDTHVNWCPKGDGNAYFWSLDNVRCNGTGQIFKAQPRECSVSGLRAVNNHFAAGVTSAVEIVGYGGSIKFIARNQVETGSDQTPLLLKVGGSYNFVEWSGWLEQAMPNRTKVVVDGEANLLTAAILRGVCPSRPVVIKSGGNVEFTGRPSVIDDNGKPFAPGDPGFDAVLAQCYRGDGSGVLRYGGGAMKPSLPEGEVR